jgi:hypothetical protein
MEIVLIVIIVVQFIFLVYSDIQNRIEREKLELKLISGGLSDYVSSTTKDVEDKPAAKEEEDPYLDMTEASVSQILASKDK